VRLSDGRNHHQEVTLPVQATNTRPRFDVVADGQGVCSHVGAALLGELSDRLRLTGELGRRANLGMRAGAYDRGQVLRDPEPVNLGETGQAGNC
jgi:hypothetical protein